MEREVGYYWVNHSKELIPARFDGTVFWHGDKILHPKNILAIGTERIKGEAAPDSGGGGCPLGCQCTSNPDGTITVTCA